MAWRSGGDGRGWIDASFAVSVAGGVAARGGSRRPHCCPSSPCRRVVSDVARRRTARCVVDDAVADGGAAPASNSDIDAYLRGFFSAQEELSYEVDAADIDGTLPEELRGTLFRCMPGKTDVAGTPLSNYWDGDGMMAAVSFCDGKVFVRNRFVRTKALMRERQAGRMLYRGRFGSERPGGRLANLAVKVKNAANSFAVYHARRLLALHDWGLPYQLDPSGLNTRGPTQIRASINDGAKMAPSCRVDARDNTLVLLAKETTPLGVSVQFREYDGKFELRRSREEEIRGYGVFHDFALTARYYVLLQPPLSFDSAGHLFGFRRYQDALGDDRSSGRSTRLILLPRDPSKHKIKVYQLPAADFVYHIANAYDLDEEEDGGGGGGGVVVDAVRYERVYLNEHAMSAQYASKVPRSTVVRYTACGEAKECDSERLSERHADFAVVPRECGARRHRRVYAVASESRGAVAPLRVLLGVDCETKTEDVWTPPRGHYCSEAAIVRGSAAAAANGARPSSYAVTLVFDGSHARGSGRSYVAILDAERLRDGPLCTVPLRSPLPHGMHSTWTDDVFR